MLLDIDLDQDIRKTFPTLDFSPRRLAQGVYDCPTWIFNRVRPDLHDFILSGNLYEKKDSSSNDNDRFQRFIQVLNTDGFLSSYGLCDSVENLLSHPD